MTALQLHEKLSAEKERLKSLIKEHAEEAAALLKHRAKGEGVSEMAFQMTEHGIKERIKEFVLDIEDAKFRIAGMKETLKSVRIDV